MCERTWHKTNGLFNLIKRHCYKTNDVSTILARCVILPMFLFKDPWENSSHRVLDQRVLWRILHIGCLTNESLAESFTKGPQPALPMNLVLSSCRLGSRCKGVICYLKMEIILPSTVFRVVVRIFKLMFMYFSSRCRRVTGVRPNIRFEHANILPGDTWRWAHNSSR